MDGIFVANDQMALAVLRTACRRGLVIPRDLAVVGFDNFAESAYFWPTLATINLYYHELGFRAVQEVLKQIEAVNRNDTIDSRTVLFSTKLVLCESSISK